MATHSSILACRIPWRERLVGPSLWGHKELDLTEQLTQTQESDLTEQLTQTHPFFLRVSETVAMTETAIIWLLNI